MKRTFIIGDVHGHLDRLEGLLTAEGIIGRCPECAGLGTFDLPSGEDSSHLTIDCDVCHGIGIARLDTDTTVIQLGDLGHFGAHGSPTGDELCWHYVYKHRWCDIVLWGNHDRALVQPGHVFSGYLNPGGATLNYVSAMHHDGRLMLASASHGHLLTHAGLHKSFKHRKLDPELKTDVVKFVNWLNDEDDRYLEGGGTPINKASVAIRDCIGARRGGRSDHGGILWRDTSESLFAGWPQVFGHSKGDTIRTYNNDSYCIDLGSPDNGRLAGMWLPERKFVQIDMTRRDPDTNSPKVERFPA